MATEEQQQDDSSDQMFDSIGKMLRQNPVYPVTITQQEAEALRIFIEKGYVNDVGGPSALRQDLWRDALSVQEKITELKMQGVRRPDDFLTFTIFEKQLSALETLTQNAQTFGLNLDEGLEAIEALFHVRDSFNQNIPEIRDK